MDFAPVRPMLVAAEQPQYQEGMMVSAWLQSPADGFKPSLLRERIRSGQSTTPSR